IDTLARRIEFPPVVDAAKPFFLVTPEEERGAAVRAGVADQSHSPGSCPEGDQVFAQEADAQRRAIGRRELFGKQEGNPVAAEDLATRRTCGDPGKKLVIARGQHSRSPEAFDSGPAHA